MPFDSQLDYGSTYEEIRVQKNYSNLGKQGKPRKWGQNDDDYAISQMSDYSMANVLAALDFLEPLFSTAWSADKEKLMRALIAALSLHACIKTLMEDSSATNVDKKTIGRVGLLVGTACGQWPDAQCLKASITSMDLLEAIVANYIGCDQCELASLDANELRHIILTISTS